MTDLDEIWKELEKVNLNKNKCYTKNEQYSLCKNCKSENLNINGVNLICYDCGLVISENHISTHQPFELQPEVVQKRCFNNYSRINKMQEWYMWSNDEKNVYKLKTYVKSLCQRLKITEILIDRIVDTVVMVMESIKRNDGTKRARVKDGIIVICIYYVSKDTSYPHSYMDMAKSLDLDIKYVTRAERIILELINSKKLNLKKSIVLDTLKPFDYITNTIKTRNLHVNSNILKDTQTLISICEDNDLLLDHTPLSVGVCCFYYILTLNNIDINLKMFSELYDLSIVTVIKTFNKLKEYEKQISKLL